MSLLSKLYGKKYILTKQTKTTLGGVILHRICATKDIPIHDVYAGDYGGWVESTRNLSQFGTCWVADEAQVYGDARLTGAAYVGEETVMTEKTT